MNSSKRENIKLGVIQCHFNPDIQALKKDISDKVQQASEQGSHLVLLQELFMIRYPGDLTKEDNPEVFDWAENLTMAINVMEIQNPTSDEIEKHSPTLAFCRELALKHRVFIVGSLFEKYENPNDLKTHYYNTAVIVRPEGSLLGKTRKQHIPSGPGYNEVDFFEPGDSDYPVHDTGKIKVAVPTCYDQWNPELARIYALKGAELILYPTCIGNEPLYPHLDTMPMWRTIMISHTIANGVFVAAANRVGKQSAGPRVLEAIEEKKVCHDESSTMAEKFEFNFYGSSFICAPGGKLLSEAPRDQPCVLVATLDFEQMNLWREAFPLLHQRQPHTYGRLLQE
ncbi:hypothetical protein C9374_000647 [Naegleria lovaniensis]|uniref:CN hydrolase domain-containing protein n=1 Tax=Naegleria lovaniensis TaxID=51637 RepID=A0AA88GZH1_NAELO|nr:uncharacterized protein C9374_000647 [Naegleria lovaniensis]KAG2388483.1 hypothetical protein C9374_000647 [Naegleria lovaniensis]